MFPVGSTCGCGVTQLGVGAFCSRADKEITSCVGNTDNCDIAGNICTVKADGCVCSGIEGSVG